MYPNNDEKEWNKYPETKNDCALIEFTRGRGDTTPNALEKRKLMFCFHQNKIFEMSSACVVLQFLMNWGSFFLSVKWEDKQNLRQCFTISIQLSNTSKLVKTDYFPAFSVSGNVVKHNLWWLIYIVDFVPWSEFFTFYSLELSAW